MARRSEERSPCDAVVQIGSEMSRLELAVQRHLEGDLAALKDANQAQASGPLPSVADRGYQANEQIQSGIVSSATCPTLDNSHGWRFLSLLPGERPAAVSPRHESKSRSNGPCYTGGSPALRCERK